MLWECNWSLVSEVWPAGIPFPFLYERDLGLRKRVYADLFTACLLNDSSQGEQKAASPDNNVLWPQTGSPQKMRLLRDWYCVIMPQVQVAELTRITDKLPCIQGIAELFKKAIGCNYLAGHWELSLIESLGWNSPGPFDMTSCTNTRPVAPSWSLASVNGKTWYLPGRPVFPVAEFLGASSTTINNGPTTVSDLCRLRIKGPAHRLGMDINEVILGRHQSLSLGLRSSWLSGPWGSKDDVAHWQSGVHIQADSHQENEMEASIQRHKDTVNRNGHVYLVTVREDSALFLVMLNIVRDDRLLLSGIITRQVSEESDGPVLERIGQWHVLVPDSERPHFADESFREGMKQIIFYLV